MLGMESDGLSRHSTRLNDRVVRGNIARAALDGASRVALFLL